MPPVECPLYYQVFPFCFVLFLNIVLLIHSFKQYLVITSYCQAPFYRKQPKLTFNINLLQKYFLDNKKAHGLKCNISILA